MAFWAAVQFHSQRERMATQFLAQAGFTIWLPRIRERCVVRGRRQHVLRPLFPGYLFLWVELQWYAAKTAPGVTGGAFPRKVGGENRTVTAGRRPWWPRMAGLQPLSTRAFGPRLRRLTALTALATRPLIATKRSTVRCGQSVCKCHAENFAPPSLRGS